ncbi:WD40 repeat-containing protein [Cavenderia fasciculata]|uniref:Probable cytosolic iron-sulfur protein assembly protein CIAO1 homolog n=1 Tax=Cavenderia fasciculata TaxID=261658 RepID=F4PHZ4_CACFS|nr:WD40 repeat-containing protein [Cavenderia fasciculata]EGG24481.1 WD40 repeat-containing protein [Cavenderia fasciculata]|eukprot:XP_004362332.1 WD40 repeat-containing protein [Cavenderia fasciculata]
MDRIKEISIIRDGLPSKVWYLAWNPQGTLLASCGDDKSIQIWKQVDVVNDVDDQQQQQWVMAAKLDVHEKTVRRIAWSPDGKLIAAASFDASTSIWELSDDMNDNENNNNDSLEFNHISTLEGHQYEVKSVAWDHTGTLLATCSRDKSIWIWQMDEEKEFECLSISHGHGQDIKCVLWHPTEEILASASYDDTIKMWQDTDGDWESINTLVGHESTVWDISFNRAGDRLVSCSDDKSVILWALVKGDHSDPSQSSSSSSSSYQWKQSQIFESSHSRTIYSVDWSKDQYERIVSTGSDDSIVLYEKEVESNNNNNNNNNNNPDTTTKYKKSYQKLNAHNSDVNCIRWCPTRAGIMASCGDDSTIRIWKII